MLFVWAIVFALLGGLFISRPFFGGDASRPEDPEVAALDAARRAKYQEIKEAEIDFRAGKLSREDYRQLDKELRRDAINILNRLEKAHAAKDR